jgi:hypothetical protein
MKKEYTAFEVYRKIIEARNAGKETFFIDGARASFEIIQKLRNVFYLVRGWQRDNAFGEWGYTIVFKKLETGIFNNY